MKKLLDTSDSSIVANTQDNVAVQDVSTGIELTPACSATVGPGGGETRVEEPVIQKTSPAEATRQPEDVSDETGIEVPVETAVEGSAVPDVQDAVGGQHTLTEAELAGMNTMDEADLAAMRTMDERATPLRTGRTGRTGRTTATLSGNAGALPIPESIGDYEILGELGRGGMGVVYRARQSRANRIVALKVIRPDSLSGMSEASRSRLIERFRHEAEAAGRLQHDNIVTVYEVGEAAGCHFFSMQFVDGCSLSDRIRISPLDNREAAGFLEPVCRAVAAAHQAGVLHRDIKPQNIMIETATGRPRIADFGLAKLMNDDVQLTRSGETMGTPPYMPPEQFGDAANVTAAADIYSLGATLYHVLSGRPPFQAASSIATMRQVLESDPPSLRDLNSAVEQDLDTICMKCLEKEPGRRFASALELADELKRYLNNEPLHSRPISSAERVLRWCRRNRTVASLIGAVIGATAVAVVALAVAYVRTESARIVVAESLDKTQAAQVLSEASFQDALSAVNEFFTRVSEERLLNEPGAQGLRKELLSLAQGYYKRLLERRENDPSVQEELAATHYRLGLIVEELESPEAALPSFQKARELMQAQLVLHPDSKSLRQFLSNTLNAEGRVQTRLRNLDLAEKKFQAARELRAALANETEDPLARLAFDRLLASVDMNLGLLQKQRGNMDGALKILSAAQEFRVRILPTSPRDRKLRRDLAKGDYNLANLALERDDSAVVRRHLLAAIRRFEELLADDPDDIEDRHMLALCLQLLGDELAATSVAEPMNADAAADSYRQSWHAMDLLVARNPAVPRYRFELAQVLLNLAELESQRMQTQAALAAVLRAETLLSELVRDLPKNADYGRVLEKAKLRRAELEAQVQPAAN